jgi:hypothetical protein
MNRVGEIYTNNQGDRMIIEKYINYEDVLIRFMDYGNFVSVRYDNLVRGKVSNPYHRSVFGVGYLGEGKYKRTINGEISNIYSRWSKMIRRCYDENLHQKHPTYKDCSVYSQWHDFQNFAIWHEDNYYQIKGERMELDKDILVKGNKQYSPDTCIFVPHNINTLFVKANAIRGSYPIGVSWNKEKRKFESNYFNRGKRIKLGYFNSVDDAFNTYKEHKENLIKQIANDYKLNIPEKLYIAMMNYRVEITD